MPLLPINMSVILEMILDTTCRYVYRRETRGVIRCFGSASLRLASGKVLRCSCSVGCGTSPRRAWSLFIMFSAGCYPEDRALVSCLDVDG